MKKILFFFVEVITCVLFILLPLEVGLQILPSIIPPKLLINFEPQLREKIALGRFPTHEDTIIYNRDDDGPELRLWKPYTRITYHDSDLPGDVFTVEADEIGFCNPQGSYNKTSRFDVITIGDSFTWCNSVAPEETWTHGLSQLTGLSTYNLGKGGAGLYEYLQILKGFGIPKHPRFVILNVYEGNDIRDAISYQDSKYHINERANSSANSYLKRFSQFLMESFIWQHSYSINLILSTFKFVSYETSSFKHHGTDFRYNIAFSEKSIPFNLENTDTDEAIYAMRLLAQEIDFKVFTEALENFVSLSKKYNFIPIVTYTPSAHTTYATNLVFNNPALEDIMKRFSNSQREFFKSNGKELGYIFIDFTPFLQSAALSSKSQMLLFYRTNLHLTKYGHEIIAKTLSESMQNLGFLR